MSFIDVSVDHHVHTKYCHHAVGEMEEYVLAAIEKKLKGITFLEHMEEGVDYFEVTWLTEKDFDNYFQEGTELKQKYRDKIAVFLGVEVGFSPYHKKRLRERILQRKWDQVGLSYHFAKSEQFEHDLNLVSRKEPNKTNIDLAGRSTVLTDYFNNLIEAVNYLPGTMLCHLDAALRHQDNLVYDESHIAQIEQLLAAVKKNNMAVEINTSGLAMRNVPFPKPHIVKRALELGIPLVASSDSHRPGDVGRFFEQLPAYVESCYRR